MPTSLLLTAAQIIVQESLQSIEEQLAAIDEAQAGETKSSAGDKFETSREMMQQELDRLQAQLTTVKDQLLLLDQAEKAPEASRIQLGSTFTLSSGEQYLIACGLGKLRKVEGKAFAISLESPLGQVLAGKAEGETVIFRDKKLTITQIF